MAGRAASYEAGRRRRTKRMRGRWRVARKKCARVCVCESETLAKRDASRGSSRGMRRPTSTLINPFSSMPTLPPSSGYDNGAYRLLQEVSRPRSHTQSPTCLGAQHVAEPERACVMCWARSRRPRQGQAVRVMCERNAALPGGSKTRANASGRVRIQDGECLRRRVSGRMVERGMRGGSMELRHTCRSL